VAGEVAEMNSKVQYETWGMKPKCQLQEWPERAFQTESGGRNTTEVINQEAQS